MKTSESIQSKPTAKPPAAQAITPPPSTPKESKTSADLTKENQTYTVLFIAWCIALFWSFVIAGDDWSKRFPELFGNLTAKAGVFMVVSPLLFFVMSYVLTIEQKVKLTQFWWVESWRTKEARKHALPGHRAFSKYCREDHRLDGNKEDGDLARALNQPRWDLDLKRYPPHSTMYDEENEKWYMLYRAFADRPSVYTVHRHFLLLCDMAWMSLCCAIVGTPVLLLRGGGVNAAYYLVIMLAVCVLSTMAAHKASVRFVTNVLLEVVLDYQGSKTP